MPPPMLRVDLTSDEVSERARARFPAGDTFLETASLVLEDSAACAALDEVSQRHLERFATRLVQEGFDGTLRETVQHIACILASNQLRAFAAAAKGAST